MRFKLPRQLLTPEIDKILAREMRKQKMRLSRATKKDMQEILEVSKIIEKSGLPQRFVRKKLSDELGYGIFLRLNAEPILQGQVIAPYAGEVSIVPQFEPDNGSYAFAPIEEMHLTSEEQHHLNKKIKYRPNRLYSMKVDAL